MTAYRCWFVVGVKYVASFSGGKDSTAMVLRLIEARTPLDYVAFYDTGMEFQAIYSVKDRIKEIASQNGIQFVELHPKEPFLYSMLERPVKSKGVITHYGYAWCGGRCRWGTTEKLRAIENFKKSLEDDVTDYVGIAADEPQRFGKAHTEGKVLPLVSWGMTEADCLRYCRERGISWIENGIDLYDVLDRVSCWCCANKNLKEMYAIYRYLPAYWERFRELQRKIDRPFKGYRSGQPIGIFELEKRFEQENAQMDLFSEKR